MAAALRSIREIMGFRLKDVAHATEIAPSSMEAFEAGTKRPSTKQVIRLSKYYGVKSYNIMLGKVPNDLGAKAEFRTTRNRPTRFSTDGYKAFTFGKKISSFIDNVYRNIPKEFEGIVLPAYCSDSPQNIAKFFREAINFEADLYIEDSVKASPAFNYIRASIELSGVNVLQSWYKHNDFRGYYFKHSNRFPTIMLHTAGWDKKSVLFTLAHEICHHLLDEEGTSSLDSRNSSESFCNKFAAELLAPVHHIDNALSKSPYKESSITQLVKYVSRRTLLSQYATAIRLRELDAISEKYFRIWIATQTQFGDQKKPGGSFDEDSDYGETILPRFGYLAANSIHDAISRNLVDKYQVALATGISEDMQDMLTATALRKISELGVENA
jgi:Zn-dependent peptidase ImmA (M78 family)/transcriptional regulator with XRE-family HTH domain